MRLDAPRQDPLRTFQPSSSEVELWEAELRQVGLTDYADPLRDALDRADDLFVDPQAASREWHKARADAIASVAAGADAAQTAATLGPEPDTTAAGELLAAARRQVVIAAATTAVHKRAADLEADLDRVAREAIAALSELDLGGATSDRAAAVDGVGDWHVALAHVATFETVARVTARLRFARALPWFRRSWVSVIHQDWLTHHRADLLDAIALPAQRPGMHPVVYWRAAAAAGAEPGIPSAATLHALAIDIEER